MNYREILKLYKQGKLEEEKRKEVEADIEKQDAISEYLFDEGAVPELCELEDAKPLTAAENLKSADGADTAETSENDFVRTIQQSIRRAFIKMGIVVGSVVLAIVLFVIFALPHVVSLFYYNPEKTVGTNEWGSVTDQMSLDMAVYTELFIPGYYRDTVIATDRGYGEYDIRINQTSSTNGLFTTVSGVIKRNQLTLYDANYFKLPTGNAFLRTEETSGYPFCRIEDENGVIHEMGAAGTPEDALEQLQKLNDGTDYLAYVTLEHLTDYDDFISWFNQKELFWKNVWCSVYAENEYGSLLLSNVGFTPYQGGTVLSYDKELYPYLRLIDGTEELPSEGEDMKTHFLSMLKYMRDNKTFFEMMTDGYRSDFDVIDFDAAIAEIEQNGMKLNGFAIVTEKEDILKLSEDERVCYIYTVPMR